MKSLANRFFLFAATTLFLGTAAYGQTLKADVPFAFRIPGGVAPAGSYEVKLDNAGRIFFLRNAETHRSMMSLGFSLNNNPVAPVAPRMVFRCGDAGCQLSEIWSSNAGYGIHTRREKAHEYVSSIPITVVQGD
jgi:hypothetical protein